MKAHWGGNLEQVSLQTLFLAWIDTGWWAGMEPVFRRMLELDLTPTEGMLLHKLQEGSMTIADAAGCLNVHAQSTASRVVDRLVRDGFVSRQEDPSDRRQKRLTLTAQGSAVVAEVEQILSRRTIPMLDALDEPEKEQFRRLLIKMLNARFGAQSDTSSPVGWSERAPDPAS